MEKREIEDIYRLTPTQEGILVHCLHAGEPGMYVDQLHSRLRGPMDREVLRRAWQEVLDRHPVLRTSFHAAAARDPLQVVRRRVPVPFEWEDWSGVPAEAREARLGALLQADRARGFALSEPPLLRLLLVRLADEEHHLVLTFHHLLLDGWSLRRIFQEVFAVYDALGRGGSVADAALPPPPRPFRDFVGWLHRQSLGEAEAFWRGALAGITAPTPLPADRTGDALPATAHPDGERSAKQRARLSAAATSALTALAQRHRLTLNTLVQGAWGILLSRYAGEREVVFGTVVSGRPPELDGVEGMIGVFINTLPVRMSVPAETPLLEWLEEVQERQAEMRRFEHCPLVQVHRWSDLPPGVPHFESILLFQNYPTGESGKGGGSGLDVAFGDVEDFERTNYPLTVEALPGRELELTIAYERDRFGDDAVGRMLGHLGALLEEMAADPLRPVAELPMLVPGEREQILDEWNRTSVPVPWDVCMHRLFEAQARRTPDDVAASCGDAALTYRELNDRANRMARRLVELGVGADVLVAILAERSLDFLTAILAVFKAGGAYLPLDPRHPAQRHAHVLEGGRPLLVLVEEPFRPVLDLALEAAGPHPAPGVHGVAELAAEAARLPAEAGEDLPLRSSPDHLAYVIFTSGSTGLPKGAMVEQKGMVNHLFAKVRDLDLTDADTVAQNASQCFDISVWQFLAALVLGGKVRIYPDEVAYDPPRLLAGVEADGITIFETVPSMLRMMLAEADRQGGGTVPLRSLRWIVPTGEALPPELCRAWLLRYPRIPMLNAYGPTECSDDVTHCVLDTPPAESVAAMPIGRPVCNMRAYVLDPALNPVPAGVAGELYVGGVGVGRGYMRDPARTAQAFVPDPHAGEPGARLYRTGDRVRWLPEGSLVFLGRLDHQVKIRGFRIELGEIEAVLARHPAVREAVVVAREDTPGDARLVAYVSPREGAAEAGPGELREALLRQLPAYMVPSAFVVLDALPQNANGKVDRKALPAPEWDRSAVEGGFTAPRDRTEAEIAGAWSELLGVAEVGVHDNFFELGGHSILASRLVALLRDRFGVEVPLRAVFETPTVAELAAAVRRLGAAADRPAEPSIRRVAREARRLARSS
ncbi:MAG TPA: amino acid adenylation domain-containing protein [Longimicrobiaceae bacterium]|nr:amino acid adenylation domain-containing protein [Longimicrobiaceae bacterium]